MSQNPNTTLPKITEADRALQSRLLKIAPAPAQTAAQAKEVANTKETAQLKEVVNTQEMIQAKESTHDTQAVKQQGADTNDKSTGGKLGKKSHKKGSLKGLKAQAKRDAAALGLSKDALPSSIVEVLTKLKSAGYEAYIVGGGVRDALVGLEPKDFDAVTNATPAQVKDVFGKRCRIIGRRFKLAHVYSGRDMIEVATFRAPPAKKDSLNDDGMIVRDNVWGNIIQDFARRDFSINALYYDPLEGVVYDFCDALGDIANKRIAFLGDTQVRIDEDPVRLLRALRFAAKLGFALDDEVHAAYTADNWAHLKTVSPHRLYDETLKLFGGGYVTKALPLLTQYGAMDYLFAHRETVITPLVEAVAANTDARIAIGKSINPAFFYAALLWPAYQAALAKYAKKRPLVEAMNKAGIQVVGAQRNITAIPKFSESFIRETWSLQPRLINPRPKQIPAIADHSRFRAAFDFLLLRENADHGSLSVDIQGATQDKIQSATQSATQGATQGMGAWWQRYQDLDDDEKEAAIDAMATTLASENRISVSMDDTALAANSKTNLSLRDGQKLPARRRPRRRKPSSPKTPSAPKT